MHTSSGALRQLLVSTCLLAVALAPACVLLAGVPGIALWVAILASWWLIVYLTNHYRNVRFAEWKRDLSAQLRAELSTPTRR